MVHAVLVSHNLDAKTVRLFVFYPDFLSIVERVKYARAHANANNSYNPLNIKEINEGPNNMKTILPPI